MSRPWLTSGLIAGTLILVFVGCTPSVVEGFEPSAAPRVAVPRLTVRTVVSLPQTQRTLRPQQTVYRSHSETPTPKPQSEEPGQPGLPSTPRPTPRNGPFPASDTLRASTAINSPLILSLPATLNDTPVTRYTMLQGPSLSGVADRSFTWIPRGIEPGTYDVRLHAHHPDTPPDTLVVRISLDA